MVVETTSAKVLFTATFVHWVSRASVSIVVKYHRLSSIKTEIDFHELFPVGVLLAK